MPSRGKGIAHSRCGYNQGREGFEETIENSRHRKYDGRIRKSDGIRSAQIRRQIEKGKIVARTRYTSSNRDETEGGLI